MVDSLVSFSIFFSSLERRGLRFSSPTVLSLLFKVLVLGVPGVSRCSDRDFFFFSFFRVSSLSLSFSSLGSLLIFDCSGQTPNVFAGLIFPVSIFSVSVPISTGGLSLNFFSFLTAGDALFSASSSFAL